MSYDSSASHPVRRQNGRAPSGTSHLSAHAGHHRALRVLRRACRWQRRVAALAALGYFTVFLALTVEAPSLMSRRALGGLPTGLLLALVQVPVTWLAVSLFEYTARRYVDPLARRVGRYGGPDDGDGKPRG
ncbi:DUF485 domain-containing protein [Streptomyces sp. JHA26]|uniref:DUF485 domain-containing protein n=1 Tax=Streptomyces sp. JHA26 TaxID=1917143 RepID=UPI00098B1070|nr:DUF485 domain-containing protein [Streptomyces sp. JHA26]